jgi:hypothetical protein
MDEELLVMVLQNIVTRLDDIAEAIGSNTEELTNLSATIAEASRLTNEVLANRLPK